MRRKLSGFIASAIALLLSAGTLPLTAAAQTAAAPVRHYTMIDLTPAGATTATAVGLSGAQQFGNAGFPSAAAPGTTENHIVLWSGGADGFTDLGVGTATAIGDGQQVGFTSFGYAALWSGTPESIVYLNPAGWNTSAANGVGGGQQVGVANQQRVCGEKKGGCGSGTYTVFQPFLWRGTAASAVNLTPFGLGFGAGQAYGTDGVQQVGVGWKVVGFGAYSSPSAMLWAGTADSAVSLNPADSNESVAYAVAGGQQVGYAYSFQHATLWTGSAASAVDLHPAGYTASQARATNGVQQAGFGWVNNAAQIPHRHALVWSGSAASVVDLNQFMPLGFTDAAVTGIDAAGNVVGWAVKGSANGTASTHAVMWVPSDAAPNFSQGVVLSQSSVVAGDSVQATVTLSQPAPAGGALVNLAGVVNTTAVTIQMPQSVTVAEGDTSASFTVSTGATTLNGFTRPALVDVQAAYGDTTQTASLAVAPPLSLTALGVAPGNVTGGTNATGTVTLSGPAPAGGALVTLSSNSAAALVPASVLVPAGLTSASFNVQTNTVTAFTTATLTATYGSIPSTQTARLVVAPPPAATDTVSIQKADYVVSKKQLTVQASSTSQTVMLTVTSTATGEVIGVLTNKGAGSYAGTFPLSASPQNITVTSDLGGTASLAVKLK
ncbi:MAG TPA: hypothetical protein VGP08_25995 [Pyrinomonadaceae bacterium]|jgi:hypothetical protein|nr:hypothetical protein [Pyrinomonadaceae bacterium]